MDFLFIFLQFLMNHESLPPHFNWNPFAGTIGHVAHGKSTLVKAISGVQVSFKIPYTNYKLYET